MNHSINPNTQANYVKMQQAASFAVQQLEQSDLPAASSALSLVARAKVEAGECGQVSLVFELDWRREKFVIPFHAAWIEEGNVDSIGQVLADTTCFIADLASTVEEADNFAERTFNFAERTLDILRCLGTPSSEEI